ncbi:MAG: DUF3336 domain-containing protein [Halieaceae bacterium]|nr:DUF3336 domain-containing protein [Halieaceae bacterium]
MTFTKRLRLEKTMSNARSYAEWSEAAIAHDSVTGAVNWKNADESKSFDYVSIRKRLQRLSQLQKVNDNAGLLFALNEGIHGNMDGIGNEHLYRKAKFGTKALIQKYTDTTTDSLNYLADPKVKDISFEEKLEFFRRAQHCYGHSALLLSGAGSFLYFHLGVAKALWEQGMLPNIMSGSSGGSVVGAMLCTHKDDEMERFFDPEFLAGISNSHDQADEGLFGRNKLPPAEYMREEISSIIPDLTFQEAYELTGRQLNISVAPAERHQNSRLLNAIASPNVCIREAVCASCAVPGIYPPIALAAKDDHGKRVPYLPNRKWADGSITHDLPAKRLSRLYGVNHHIVSQANPLVTPFTSSITPQRTYLSAIRNASRVTMKAWINANATIMQRQLSRFPALNSMTNIALSVMNQSYTGDINIIRPTIFWSPAKMISKLGQKDIKFLVELGERTTWPKIEMVRIQTKVSRALERILVEYEHDLLHDPAHVMKKKIA